MSLAADALAGIVVLVDMMDMNDRRNSWYTDAMWTWGSSREEDAFAPVSIEERERYWESLGAGGAQPIARSPACVSLPSDWIFELRTDR